MTSKKLRHFLWGLILLCCLNLFFASYQSVQAQAGTPGEMHQGINNLRAANGLLPLSVNPYLVQSAQTHANWIAAGNPGGHTGEGGSTSKDRALVAGYGEGAEVFVTENWARGPNLTVEDCIYTSWNDPSHMNNMLTTRHNEFGTGIALDMQGMTVYVVNFGHVSGSIAPEQTTAAPDDDSTPPSEFTPTPTVPTSTPVPIIQPVTTAEPNPDGSVIHIVQFGHSLWAIADAYDIPMPDLLAQNDLSEESVINPDQELLIKPASGVEPEETTEETTIPAAAVEPTPTPSHTPTENAPPEQTEPIRTPTETPAAGGNFLRNIFSGDTLWVGIGLVAVSVFGVGLLLFTSARLR